MALTNELLNANASLAGLTDNQKAAIVEMSVNDENSVIANKTREIYDGLDADVLAASGIAKNSGEKTYDYAKRAIGEIKGQAGDAAELRTKVTQLENEKTRLEGVIAKGGADAETKRQLEQARQDLANVTKEYTTLKSNYESEKEAHTKALFDAKLDNEFAKATGSIKFKADLPASVTSVLLQQAIAKVKGMHPEYIDDGNGGKVLAFMENGAVKRNPATNLQPYSATELIESELKAMGVLEEGRKQTGTGTKVETTGAGALVADISGARTQDEAHEIIAKQLMAEGKTAGSKEFNDAMAAAWKENYEVIKKLPIR